MQRVALLQTSDLHGRLPEAAMRRIPSLRHDLAIDCHVDSGDAVGAGNLGYRPEEPIWDALRALGLTAMALGNREAHVWQSVMEKKIAPAPCPVLCANLETRSGTNPTIPHLIHSTSAGVRVGFLGLTVPMVTRKMWGRHLSDLLFHPPIEIAAQAVPELRDEVDLLVVLSHIGLREDRRLAESVRGIDLILGGHSHIELRRPESVGATVICQPGGFGRYATVAICARASETERWSIEATLQPLTESGAA